jgi:hypothetical protein
VPGTAGAKLAAAAAAAAAEATPTTAPTFPEAGSVGASRADEDPGSGVTEAKQTPPAHPCQCPS